MHSDCLKMSNTFSLHFTFPLRFFINHDVIASQSLNLKKYLQLNIFLKLYFNTLNMNKQILHCRPRNFTTFTKQNLSRCLSLKFLSAEMDKYILHIRPTTYTQLPTPMPVFDRNWIIGLLASLQGDRLHFSESGFSSRRLLW